MTELVLTPTTEADGKPLSLPHQIAKFVIEEARFSKFSRSEANQLASVIGEFIRTTPLAPALDGEPIFVLRAQDKIAPSHVMSWANDAYAHDCDHNKADGARRIATEMIAWQMAHPDRVKTPD